MGFVPFTFIDLIDILFVAYIMYWICLLYTSDAADE